MVFSRDVLFFALLRPDSNIKRIFNALLSIVKEETLVKKIFLVFFGFRLSSAFVKNFLGSENKTVEFIMHNIIMYTEDLGHS